MLLVLLPIPSALILFSLLLYHLTPLLALVSNLPVPLHKLSTIIPHPKRARNLPREFFNLPPRPGSPNHADSTIGARLGVRGKLMLLLICQGAISLMAGWPTLNLQPSLGPELYLTRHCTVVFCLYPRYVILVWTATYIAILVGCGVMALWQMACTPRKGMIRLRGESRMSIYEKNDLHIAEKEIDRDANAVQQLKRNDSWVSSPCKWRRFHLLPYPSTELFCNSTPPDSYFFFRVLVRNRPCVLV
ncbi:hypothetical protein I305_03892 [Cryptococcus gattii E566]|uniref:Uncharacterized protein n=2 Tax=Cryptococcus gattii TaxID=37769 RepID=E6R4P7_CRYGW|nr:Hypothetical protein CGB_D7740C [Cryptococcus gattii WM276]ADV22034.1 Hypothetical protein CGB_D7740C [Cryptococcus gattii WM276]KIR80456.1 hypothetical protein I306_02433 [Cryptococcus gattii EJB2]KIY33501.1 hypothetical protein I305_03892 [Cryptococcus gattii E566]KJD99520.1 hypothetical protein I311_06896 [Cryptococcus gattii NT-10]